MDRLDTWLNAQRGWRRLPLMIATWYGSTLSLGCSVWELSTSEFTLPVLDATVIAVLALPGAACIGSVLAANYARNALNPKRKKGLPPFFMWRTTVGLWLITFDLSIGALIPHHGHHKAILALSMILVGGYFLLVVETHRYTGRFTRPRGADLPESMM